MPLPARRSYHHGELKAALVAAADDIIRDSGIEGFSLREAARRAGVSPGAPAHHFNGIVGLLTEVTILIAPIVKKRTKHDQILQLQQQKCSAATAPPL